MPESFRWYLSHDRQNEAKKVIKYVAKRNKQPITDQMLDEYLKAQSDIEMRKDTKYTIIQLFRTRRLTRITLLSMINW